MRKECTLEWVDDNGNVIPNSITESPNDAIKRQNDVIEVILCKDCRHYEDGMVGYCWEVGRGVSGDFFCAHGERREP